MPLALTDQQIAELKTIAATIPRRLRAVFTQRLAELLQGPRRSGRRRRLAGGASGCAGDHRRAHPSRRRPAVRFCAASASRH